MTARVIMDLRRRIAEADADADRFAKQPNGVGLAALRKRDARVMRSYLAGFEQERQA